ncbi:MAG: Ni/Fe hydrogenase subunit alpha [Halobacteria archaeon]|nr:Ni/Fe hydrogenase subunit alpha [Halobacteria archaeon]
MSKERKLNIKVPVLARVEGAGALRIKIRQGRIKQAELDIFEPPRLFERLLIGRDYHEVPDMVARICGICPVAYQMSAVSALEGIFGLDPGARVRAMRRVFYCGEWMQSHALHIHLLALPDFLGFDSAPAMAKAYPDEVRRGLALQALGNDIIRLFGGRSVHPVGACVGGFHHTPDRPSVRQLLDKLQASLPQAEALLRWTAALDLPEDDQDFCSVSLTHPQDYPMIGERMVSSSGLDIGIEDFEDYVNEYQVPHSTALHALLHGETYLVGPLARMNLNQARLPPATRELLAECSIRFPSRNMYHSLIARAAEIHLALTEAIRLLEEDSDAQPLRVAPQVRAGTGFGASEAPRGLLYHRYEVTETGTIASARIVPPTSQNQARMEQDLVTSLENYGLQHAADALQLRAETVIRNYDPCISCATHFLRLRVEHD